MGTNPWLCDRRVSTGDEGGRVERYPLSSDTCAGLYCARRYGDTEFVSR